MDLALMNRIGVNRSPNGIEIGFFQILAD